MENNTSTTHQRKSAAEIQFHKDLLLHARVCGLSLKSSAPFGKKITLVQNRVSVLISPLIITLTTRGLYENCKNMLISQGYKQRNKIPTPNKAKGLGNDKDPISPKHTQFIVPADTVKPSSLNTGSDSPDSMDSSTTLLPARTLPCRRKFYFSRFSMSKQLSFTCSDSTIKILNFTLAFS